MENVAECCIKKHKTGEDYQGARLMKNLRKFFQIRRVNHPFGNTGRRRDYVKARQ